MTHVLSRLPAVAGASSSRFRDPGPSLPPRSETSHVPPPSKALQTGECLLSEIQTRGAEGIVRKFSTLWVMLIATAIGLATAMVVPVAAQAPGHGKNRVAEKTPESTAPDTTRGGSGDAPSASDLNAIYRIKDEGFNHSQVMDIMSYLADVYGPRLTNSPNVKEAAKWTMDKLNEWQARECAPGIVGPVWAGLVERALLRADDCAASL